MNVYNFDLASPKTPLFIKYFHLSRKYESNFDLLHNAFLNGVKDIHLHCLHIENDLMRQIKKIRSELNLINDRYESVEKFGIKFNCVQCKNDFHHPTMRAHKKKLYCPTCTNKRVNERALLRSRITV